MVQQPCQQRSCPSGRPVQHKASAVGRSKDLLVGETNGNHPGATSSRTFNNSASLVLKLRADGHLKINGRPMLLKIDNSEKSHCATGLNVWDGGICLAKYVEKFYAGSSPAGASTR